MSSNSGRGCSLDERVRIQTLKAMGIQPWFLKHAPSVETLQIPQPQPPVEPVVDAVQTLNEPPINTQPVAMSTQISELNWQQLQQAVSQCQLCELHTHRNQTVFGVGDAAADLLIIGEAPGAEEDRLGEPFVGPAGKLLDAMLMAIDLDRGRVYITNVLKCRPADNRNPRASEIICCDVYLQRQIELVQPKLILALGRIAAHHLLVTKDALGTLRNKLHSYHGIPLLVSYHPAYLLRKPIDKRKSWQDLLQVKYRLNGV
jgi:DNA polymerase